MHWLFAIFLSVLAMACNDDVFVDRPNLTDDKDVVLKDCMDVEQVAYSTDGLEKIDLQLNEICRVVLYDAWSNEIGTVEGSAFTTEAVSASDIWLVKVDASSTTFCISTWMPGVFEFSASNNHSIVPFKAVLTLTYATHIRKINVTVLPGELYKVDSYWPVNEEVSSSIKDEVFVMTYSNNSDTNVRIKIYPYQHYQARASIIYPGHVNYNDIFDAEDIPNVPFYTVTQSGEPTEMPLKVELKQGIQQISDPYTEDLGWEYMLPPHTSYRFLVTLSVAHVITPFTIYASLQYEGVKEFPAEMDTYMAINHKIEYKRVE